MKVFPPITAIKPVTGPHHGPSLADQLSLILALAGTSDKRGHQDQRKAIAYVETVAESMLSALKGLVEAVQFTPLGIRGLKALEPAQAAIAAATDGSLLPVNAVREAAPELLASLIDLLTPGRTSSSIIETGRDLLARLGHDVRQHRAPNWEPADPIREAAPAMLAALRKIGAFYPDVCPAPVPEDWENLIEVRAAYYHGVDVGHYQASAIAHAAIPGVKLAPASATKEDGRSTLAILRDCAETLRRLDDKPGAYRVTILAEVEALIDRAKRRPSTFLTDKPCIFPEIGFHIETGTLVMMTATGYGGDHCGDEREFQPGAIGRIEEIATSPTGALLSITVAVSVGFASDGTNAWVVNVFEPGDLPPVFPFKLWADPLAALRAAVQAYDDKMDDAANDGINAWPPTGDDYNELYDIIMQDAR